MNTYRITTEGTDDPSTCRADTPEAAMLLFVQEAGYRDVAAAATACGQSVEAFMRDFHIVRVDDRTPATASQVRAYYARQGHEVRIAKNGRVIFRENGGPWLDGRWVSDYVVIEGDVILT